ncbi:SDR family oxidoreductase [Arthrobacter sp. MMS24-S77]
MAPSIRAIRQRAGLRGLERRDHQRPGVKLGRFGTAEEVAFHILTLLSPLSGYTTGATIDVGGGVGRYV